jgi:hypothetical protein
MGEKELLHEQRKLRTNNRNELLLIEGLSTLSPYRRIMFYECIQDLTILLNGHKINNHLTLTDMEIVAKVLILEDQTTELSQRFKKLFLK